MQATMTVLLIS